MAEWTVNGLEASLLRDKKLQSKEIDRVKVLEYGDRIVLRLGRSGHTSTRDVVLERETAKKWPGNLFSYAKAMLDIALISWKAETAPSQGATEEGVDE